MKSIYRAMVGLCAFGSASAALAGDLTGQSSYYGTIDAVAAGFFDHVGIGLAGGTTCRGRHEVILLTTNPRYLDILSMLITAQASQTKVKLFAPASQPAFNSYCTVSEAALGNFAPW